MKLVICTHKEYRMPEGDCFLPLQVGAALSESDYGYARDDIGDNISQLNPRFCELTGLYWAWKNLEESFVGIEQYRRRFIIKKGVDEKKIYLPKKRRYYIETLYSHYAHTHDERHLVTTRHIIEEMFPQYLSAFDKALSKTSGYMFNMFIMPKQVLDEYCSWLFQILFELDNRVDSSDYSSFDKRFIGRIGELLLNVWVEYKQVEAVELSYEEDDVDWLKKIRRFLNAKLKKVKYEKSA